MQILQQILFVAATAATVWFFRKNVLRIRRNIFLGKPLAIQDHPSQRWSNVALLALGQKKMFKKLVPAFFHFIIYAGFIIINIEVLEIVLDGVFGTHRLFAPILGSAYGLFISVFEVLAAGVLLSCVVFLTRRHILLLPRFRKPEMKGWPSLDADLILYVEIVLMLAFLGMNAADVQLQARGADHYPAVGPFLISGWLSGLFEGLSISSLVVVERVGWWAHILGIFAFLNYIPYSKHLHIFLAFPNAYYASLDSQGKMDNMPAITNEVKAMMDPEAGPDEDAGADPDEVPSFGAKDVNELNWRHLLGAYSCTECGRCTAACPANMTGKKLSPRKIMMDTRDRAAELGAYRETHGPEAHDGKQLIGADYISEEELRACTACQACIEACPVQINPLSIILELRRYAIMEESNAPNQWNVMFGNIENNMAPWAFSPSDRMNWADELAREQKEA